MEPGPQRDYESEWNRGPQWGFKSESNRAHIGVINQSETGATAEQWGMILNPNKNRSDYFDHMALFYIVVGYLRGTRGAWCFNLGVLQGF